MPEKVKELEAIWWREAEKYNVLPLDASVVTPPRRAASQSSPPAAPSSASPAAMTGISNGVAPSILNASYTFTAEVTVPEGGGDGMIITQGGRFAGYGFYINKGKPTFDWNLVGLKQLIMGSARTRCPLASTRSCSTSSMTAWASARWPSTTSAASASPAPAS